MKGKNNLSINVSEDSIYKIEYDSWFRVNILNYTDGEIYVSSNENFDFDGDVAEVLTIGSKMFYNGFATASGSIYIKALKTGVVVIARET